MAVPAMAAHGALAQQQLQWSSVVLHPGAWCDRNEAVDSGLEGCRMTCDLVGLSGSCESGWRPVRPRWQSVGGQFLLRSRTGRAPSGASCALIPSDGEIERLCESGQLLNAVDALGRMDQQGIVPSVEMYRCLLKACTKKKALAQAKQVHAHLIGHGLESTRYLGESVVKTLVKCGSLEDALKVFHRLPHRTVVSWSAVIAGYTRTGKGQEALKLYELMREEGVRPNKYTFISLVKACSSVDKLEEGKRIHADAVKYSCESDVVVGTCLVDMYAKCGSIMEAQAVFDRLHQRDVVSWTAMLVAYVQQGQPEKALQMHAQLQAEGVTPDAWIFVCVLQACGMLAEHCGEDGELLIDEGLRKGKAIHSEAWKRGYASDVFVGSALVSMYAKCGSIGDAQGVFDGLACRNVVSWNAMLSGYAHQGEPEKALQLYDRMQEEGVSPNDRTFVSALQACGSLAEREDNAVEGVRSTKLESLRKGKRIHAGAQARGYASDVFVGSALISMYGKCGSIGDAQHVFDCLPERNVVSWNAMIAAYSHQGQMEESLRLYARMHKEGLVPDDTTLTYILSVCSNRGALDVCMQIHQDFISVSNDFNLLVANTLIHTYGKCGRMEDAQQLFDALPQPDVGSWNALIAGYARQGTCERSLQCYDKMQELGLKPDGVTLLSVLSACNHSGMVDKGVEHFKSMLGDPSIRPDVHHYVTMVDLLGRAGYFTMVEDLLSEMPMPPNRSLWLCLLSACRKHGNIALGERAFESAVRLQPKDSAPYVLMSNIYAQAGMQDCAHKVNESRQEAGAWKQPGQTWIDHQQEAHIFVVGEKKAQPETHIHDLLQDLSYELEGARPVPCASDHPESGRVFSHA